MPRSHRSRDRNRPRPRSRRTTRPRGGIRRKPTHSDGWACHPTRTRPMTRHRLLLTLLPVAACLCGGCAALTNPVADGIPVRRLPEEVLGRPKTELHPVPLTMLRQRDPGEYRLDRGDVLGVYVENLLGNPNQPIPVQVNPNPNAPRAVSQGYP